MRKQLVRTLAAGAALSLFPNGTSVFAAEPEVAFVNDTPSVRRVPSHGGEIIEIVGADGAVHRIPIPDGGKAAFAQHQEEVAIVIFTPGSTSGSVRVVRTKDGKELWNKPIAVEERVDEASVRFDGEQWVIDYTGFPYDQQHFWSPTGEQTRGSKRGKCCYNPPRSE